MTNLKDKAVDIKGKKYVLVSDRVLAFNETYKDGSITTELLSEPNSDKIVVKATVMPDCSKPDRKFTGLAQEVVGDGYINKTSALENAETSAVGRALAMMGIGVIDSIASVDEVNKATNNMKQPAKSILATKLKKAGVADEDYKNNFNKIKELIETKSGIVIKDASELSEEKSRAIVDAWFE